MSETRTIPLELLERAIELLHNYRDLRLFKDRKYTTEDDEALGCFIDDLESVKAAEESRAGRIVREIWDALHGQGFEVANLHRNGDLEPLDNIFDFNDWTLEPTAREGQKEPS